VNKSGNLFCRDGQRQVNRITQTGTPVDFLRLYCDQGTL
jgi:hypothetical protein